ncbi:MAG: hypothetical protein RLZZ241_1458 [Bacteroidota bacterium]|jgi:Gnt-I system high-affinity gluconate transporter
MPLLIVIGGILLLFLLVVRFKLNAFLAFILVALGVGLGEGMQLSDLITSIQNGIGNTLGFLLLILGLGAMLGKLVADSGAAQRITDKLVQKFGRKYMQWALVLTGFIVGIPMFYSVGFVILVPLVFTVAASTRLPLLYIGVPMLAALSVTHGYLPPHPAPTAIVGMFGADFGKTLIYGVLVAIPAIIVAGPLLSQTFKKIPASPMKEFVSVSPLPESALPGMGISVFSALLPVLLIAIATLGTYVLPEESPALKVLNFLGNPVLAMLIAVLVAMFTLGLSRGKQMSEVMQTFADGVQGITMVTLIIAGAGALKEVLVDSGVSDYLADLLRSSSVSPLILAWSIAALIRVCVGSATVAGLTAAGIVLPLIGQGGTSPELMVLAIGSGSLIMSHVNDSGFWLFKSYFNLTVQDTLRTWTLMETTVGVMGLLGVLTLNALI